MMLQVSIMRISVREVILYGKKYNPKIIFGVAVVGIVLVINIVWIFSLSEKRVLNADYPYYTEVEDITKAADAIIVGKVIDAEKVQEMNVNTDPQTRNEVDSIPYTVSKFEAIEIVKGDINVGDIIEVKQIGYFKNIPEATLEEIDGYFKLGNLELLFLASYDDGTPYSTLNPTQGAVQVLEDQTLYSASKYSLFGYETKARSVPQTLDDAIEKISQYIK